MSVVFLSPCVCEGNFGGVQFSGRLALEALVRHAPESAAVCFRGPATSAVGHSGCTSSKVAAVASAARERSRAAKILVWHIDLLKLLPFVKRRRNRIFLFLHGIECWKKMSRLTDTLLASVDVFLSNSAYTWNRFVKSNPRWQSSSHRILPLGLGTIEPSRAHPCQAPSAVIVGRLEEREAYKGHKELIQAWPLVRQIHPSAELWTVGGGNLEPELKAIAVSLGLKDAVKFHGRVPDERKVELISQSRCLLLPSRGEGFGLVYLEAMRLGRPCLVSNTDAGREVVNPPEAGLAVDPADIKSLSEASARLLADGAEWDAWSLRARTRYEMHYTAAHFQERLLQVLDI